MLAGGYIAGAALCAWSAVKMRDDEIPRTAVFTAVFFLASLIHFKIAVTSVHLLMNGLVGIVLGRRCCLAISIGLFLQAALFGHGGFSVLGVNICLFTIPALCAWQLFESMKGFSSRYAFLIGGLCGSFAVFLSGILFMLILQTVGESFWAIARIALLAHIPIMIIEGIVTGFTVDFLTRVQPVLLRKEVSS
jgi:cobalt/nickel transport system permease protein